jgi:hypothetical protein
VASLGAVTDVLEDAAELRRLPPGLWDRLRLDPVRAPEHIALAAGRTFAPQAERWAASKRARFNVTPAELARMARTRHATLARLEGAATGVGGVFTIIPDLAGLAWIQARLVFYIAAAYGYDPHDPMRPAELLVLHGFYPDPPAARRALDGIGTTLVEAYIGSTLKREETLVLRLSKMIGVRSARHLAGRMIPGVAIVFNAVGNERRTRELAARAMRFYGG